VAFTEVIVTYQNIILEFMPPIYLRSVFLIYEFMAINFSLELLLQCPIGSDRLCFHSH
jgi:hypothetical protein